jgi:hypothetical protein
VKKNRCYVNIVVLYVESVLWTMAVTMSEMWCLLLCSRCNCSGVGLSFSEQGKHECSNVESSGPSTDEHECDHSSSPPTSLLHSRQTNTQTDLNANISQSHKYQSHSQACQIRYSS